MDEGIHIFTYTHACTTTHTLTHTYTHTHKGNETECSVIEESHFYET